MKSMLSHRRTFALALTAATLLLGGIASHAAMNVYLELLINGTRIDGESMVPQLGGVDVSRHIECTAITHELFGADTGRLTHTPLKFVKRIDRSSPLLYQALDRQEPGDAEFKYFRPQADGSTELYYTIVLKKVRVSSIRQWFPSTFDSTAVAFPHMEEVSLIYSAVLFRYEPDAIEYEIEAAIPQ